MRKASFIPLFHPKVFSRIAVRGYRIGEACRLPFFFALPSRLLHYNTTHIRGWLKTFLTRSQIKKIVPARAHLGYKESRGVKCSNVLNFRAFRRNWVFFHPRIFNSVLDQISYSLKRQVQRKKPKRRKTKNFAPYLKFIQVLVFKLHPCRARTRQR